MGLLGKLIKTGVAAGIAYTAVKVNEKYKANAPADPENPAQKAETLKQSAGEVFQEISEFAREKAPGVKESVASAAHRAETLAKEYAPGVVEKVQSAAVTVSAKAQQFADSLSSDVMDADFTPVEQPASEEPMKPIEVEKKDGTAGK